MKAELITPEQFKEAMKTLTELDDIEEFHARADILLCKVLLQLGYGDGVKLFVDAQKWYS